MVDQEKASVSVVEGLVTLEEFDAYKANLDDGGKKMKNLRG